VGIHRCGAHFVKPPRSILDRAFPYTPAHKTNVRETIERVKREQEEQRLRDQAIREERDRKTSYLRKSR
jgi:hypothetical protein